ncbi:MAG: hypothetical protein ABI479_02835 [Gallionella sp.]
MATEKDLQVEEWLLERPLYSPIELGDDVYRAVKAILNYKKTFDVFCPGCKQSATFGPVVSAETEVLNSRETVLVNRMKIGDTTPPLSVWHLNSFSKQIICTRNHHHVDFHFVMKDKTLIKIGQYPSLADIVIGDVSQFEKALGENRLHELNKAIGLAAHGVGIGSYVYLRRVFESLIEEAHSKATNINGWSEEIYEKSRMKEKVQLLRDYLPEFIVQHPEMYSILSLGVHELTEDECLKYFEALKSAILVIAEDRLHKIQQEKRLKIASQAISDIAGSL